MSKNDKAAFFTQTNRAGQTTSIPLNRKARRAVKKINKLEALPPPVKMVPKKKKKVSKDPWAKEQ